MKKGGSSVQTEEGELLGKKLKTFFRNSPLVI
jgi:hypothetical protein